MITNVISTFISAALCDTKPRSIQHNLVKGEDEGHTILLQTQRASIQMQPHHDQKSFWDAIFEINCPVAVIGLTALVQDKSQGAADDLIAWARSQLESMHPTNE